MSKTMISGLAILAAFIVVLILTKGDTSLYLFTAKKTVPTSFALLGAAGVGVVVGALLRK
ncbi:MAG TPA: hypothetical protein DCM68_02295 [Verrucomicrobia bacterium]|nr:hypothetical protein [Verrucomicrobiota bacterium]